MNDFVKELDALVSLQKSVRDLNPALGALYPVALVVDQRFLVYDIDPGRQAYAFVKDLPLPMPVPEGVRAAFQLEGYGGRIACVVTPDVFDSREGYITLLHEFVHCYQYETCEQDLKKELDIARKAQEVGNCMWEIDHPFPYESQIFTRDYLHFLSAIKRQKPIHIEGARRKLRSYLGVHDYEYMVWQEWKEGFARWVENRVNAQLGLPVNRRGLAQPFSRILFYAGGEACISYWFQLDPGLTRDLRRLFYSLYGDVSR